MLVEIIIPIATAIVLFLIIAWLFKVINASIKTMLTIAAILIVLQVAFDIDSQEFIQEVLQIIDRIIQTLFNQ